MIVTCPNCSHEYPFVQNHITTEQGLLVGLQTCVACNKIDSRNATWIAIGADGRIINNTAGSVAAATLTPLTFAETINGRWKSFKEAFKPRNAADISGYLALALQVCNIIYTQDVQPINQLNKQYYTNNYADKNRNTTGGPPKFTREDKNGGTPPVGKTEFGIDYHKRKTVTTENEGKRLESTHNSTTWKEKTSSWRKYMARHVQPNIGMSTSKDAIEEIKRDLVTKYGLSTSNILKSQNIGTDRGKSDKFELLAESKKFKLKYVPLSTPKNLNVELHF